MWESLFVCWGSFEGVEVLKGSVGVGWAGVFLENRSYRDGNKRGNAYLESRVG
jgi:hypothetical protein